MINQESNANAPYQQQANNISGTTQNGLPQDSPSNGGVRQDTKASGSSKTAAIKSTVNSAAVNAEILMSVRNVGRVMKCGVFALVIFILVSVALNIVQAIQNSCKNLDDEVDRLQNENEQLAASITGLREEQAILNATIVDLGLENEKLQINVENLEGIHEELQDNLSALEAAETQLGDLIANYNTNYNDFKERVEELMENLGESEDNLNTVTSNYNEIYDNVSVLTGQVSDIKDDLAEIVEFQASAADQFTPIFERDSFYQEIIFKELGNAQLGFTQNSYNALMTNLKTIFKLEDSDITSIRTRFPFSASFDYDDARQILPFIRNEL